MSAPLVHDTARRFGLRPPTMTLSETIMLPDGIMTTLGELLHEGHVELADEAPDDFNGYKRLFFLRLKGDTKGWRIAESDWRRIGETLTMMEEVR